MEKKLKKLSFIIIIALFSIGVTACKNSSSNNTGTHTGTNAEANTSINEGDNTSVNNKITIEKAKEIALKHAGLTKAQVSFVRAESFLFEFL